MKIEKVILKAMPYLAASISGLIFFFTGNEINANFRGLFHNIAAAFFAIPLLFLFYELAVSFSNRKLNKEIHDFIKLHVDTEVLSIIGRIFKIVYGYDSLDFSFSSIRQFLTMDKGDLTLLLQGKKFLGFQIFKDWGKYEIALQRLLENTFITGRVDNEYVISIVRMIKNLRSIEQLQSNFDIFEKVDEKKEVYEIFSNVEVDAKQIEPSIIYLLLRKLDNAKGVVLDSDSFAEHYVENLLTCYHLKRDFLCDYAQEISDIKEEINNWVSISGSEFLIDTKQFRVISKPKEKKGEERK